MRITSATKYMLFRRYEKYLTPEAVEKIKEAAEQEFGKMYELTFAQFYACSQGDFSEMLGDMSRPTVLQVYWAKRFAEFIEEFANQLKRLIVRQTADEMTASQGLLQVDWAESLLVFVQSYFGMHSFKEAEKITIGEILIAKRARYNQELFQRKIAKIQTAKLRRK